MKFDLEKFTGSELYLGFPKENVEAIAAQESGGFACIEDDFNDVMDLDLYEPYFAKAPGFSKQLAHSALMV